VAKSLLTLDVNIGKVNIEKFEVALHDVFAAKKEKVKCLYARELIEGHLFPFHRYKPLL
jgi:hypothetical protein